MPFTPSPLRYPGGKTQLYPLVRQILAYNGILGGAYIEPFAGGDGLAIKLLLRDEVENIVFNDFDKAVYSVWHSILYSTDELCSLIEDSKLSIEEWQEHKQTYEKLDSSDLLALGFSTFYLNRTNVSGIIKGGVIGGKSQQGAYKIDARFNRLGLIKRIRDIAEHRDRISLSNIDAVNFVDSELVSSQKKALINFDPPYVLKGGMLYKNSYCEKDHVVLANKIHSCQHPWITTYDICPLIKELYSNYRSSVLGINYSIGDTRSAKEYIFFSHNIKLPPDLLPLACIQAESRAS